MPTSSGAVKDDYVPPVFLSDEARDLNDRFYLILHNIVDSYPRAKLKPNEGTIYDSSITNKTDYDNSMAQMLQLQSDYFTYRNSVVSNSETLLNQIAELDGEINTLDAQNAELQSQLSELANSGRSAEGMLDDSQLTRNQMFYGNIVLFLIMMTGGYLYYTKVYKAATSAS